MHDCQYFFLFKLVGTILFYQKMERLLQFTLPTSVTNTMNRMLRVNGMSKHLRVKDLKFNLTPSTWQITQLPAQMITSCLTMTASAENIQMADITSQSAEMQKSYLDHRPVRISNIVVLTYPLRL